MLGSSASSLFPFGWCQTSNWSPHQGLSVAITSVPMMMTMLCMRVLYCELKQKSKVYPALPLLELVLLPAEEEQTLHIKSITTTGIEFSDLCAAPEARCAEAWTHPVEPTSTLATTNPPHLAACRPSSPKCSSRPYNKDSSIDFFYKVVEGLVPAMLPEHFLTQQRPRRLVCFRPNRSAFSPSRLKMQ